jgi:hypothetical protein
MMLHVEQFWFLTRPDRPLGANLYASHFPTMKLPVGFQAELQDHSRTYRPIAA